MDNKLFIDTCAFYAFLDKKDRHHGKVNEVVKTAKWSFFTSNFIIDELITLLKIRRVPLKYYSSFVDDLFHGNICTILQVDSVLEVAAWNFFKKYADHDFSFTDCTSFAIMKMNGIDTACSVDKHFNIAGFDVVPSKVNS
jgi:uncharacterized protein